MHNVITAELLNGSFRAPIAQSFLGRDATVSAFGIVAFTNTKINGSPNQRVLLY